MSEDVLDSKGVRLVDGRPVVLEIDCGARVVRLGFFRLDEDGREVAISLEEKEDDVTESDGRSLSRSDR